MLKFVTVVVALAAHLAAPAADHFNPIKKVSDTAAPQAAVRGAAVDVYIERVLDGDTVIVRGWRERVRLANIDAPEMSHGYGKPGQPFSVQSTKWLTAAAEGKAGVTARCFEKDRYGRQVCDLVKDGKSLNKELVRAGLAWANTANPRYLRDRTVLDAQIEAREAHRGLWEQPKQTPPWEWRHGCWERKATCD